MKHGPGKHKARKLQGMTGAKSFQPAFPDVGLASKGCWWGHKAQGKAAAAAAAVKQLIVGQPACRFTAINLHSEHAESTNATAWLNVLQCHGPYGNDEAANALLDLIYLQAAHLWVRLLPACHSFSCRAKYLTSPKHTGVDSVEKDITLHKQI